MKDAADLAADCTGQSASTVIAQQSSSVIGSSEVSLGAETGGRAHSEGRARILAALGQLGTMQCAIALAALGRNKALAVYLRPEGFGEFTQLMAIAAPIHVFVQCGMHVGLSRNTAAAQQGADRQRQLATANLLTLMLGAVSLTLVAVLILSPVADRLLPSLGLRAETPQKLMLLFLLSLAPLEALRNNFLSFLQGLLDFKGISAKRSIAVLTSAAAAVPLIAFFGISGACLQVALASLLTALLLGARCHQNGFRPMALAWDGAAARLLGSFGAACLVVGFSQNSVDALIRANLISTGGVAQNGIYQAALGLSIVVTGVILGSVGAYSLAACSQTRDVTLMRGKLDELLRIVLPLSTLGLGTVGLLSQPLIVVLFSSKFGEAAKCLPLLMAANHVQAATWALGAPLLGHAMIRQWIGVQLISVSIRYATAILLTDRIGAQALAAGLLFGMLFDLSGYAFVCRRMGISLPWATIKRLALSTMLVAAAAAAGAWADGIIEFAVAATLFCFLVAAIFRCEASAFGKDLSLWSEQLRSQWSDRMK